MMKFVSRLPLRVGAVWVAILAAAFLLVPPAGAQRKEGTEVKVPDTYRLQAGDEVSVSVLPRKEFDCGGTVLPDGKLYLKNVGEIRAEGMTIPQLTEAVRKELLKELVRPRVTITILKLANPILPPRITVTGAVVRPGPLDLQEGLRLKKAVELAGGTVKDADLARVLLTRRNLSRTVVNLSDSERALNPAENPLLEDGDSIEIPLRLNKVTVIGAVPKPGPLELDLGLRLMKAIEMAGGPAKDADLTKVLIVRKDLTRLTVDVGGERQVSNSAQNLLLQDGDSVQVPFLYKVGYVSISGAVIKAGKYEIKPNMTLNDLIVQAGKVTPLADVQRIQMKRAGKAETISLASRQKEGLAGDIPLEPGDELFVPEVENVVVLIGAIPNPGIVPFRPGQKLRDFLTQPADLPEGASSAQENGSYRYNAAAISVLDGSKVDLKHAQLIRRGEPAVRVDLTAVLKKEENKGNLALKTGDVLFLPPKNLTQKRSIWDYVGPFAYLFQAL